MCTARGARGDDYAIVGQDDRTLTLDSTGEAHGSGSITTLRHAANAEAGTCEQDSRTPPAYQPAAPSSVAYRG